MSPPGMFPANPSRLMTARSPLDLPGLSQSPGCQKNQPHPQASRLTVLERVPPRKKRKRHSPFRLIVSLLCLFGSGPWFVKLRMTNSGGIEMRRIVWQIGFCITCLLTLAAGVSAQKVNRTERHELRADRHEIKADTRDIRSDRRDIRQDVNERNSDARELRQDRREGASQEELRADRQEINSDSRDLRSDRRDLGTDVRDRRGDVRDYRQDRRDARKN